MTGEKRQGPPCDLGFLAQATLVGERICIPRPSSTGLLSLVDMTAPLPLREELIPFPIVKHKLFHFSVCAGGRDEVIMQAMLEVDDIRSMYFFSFDVRTREWKKLICDDDRSLFEGTALVNDRWLIRQSASMHVMTLPPAAAAAPAVRAMAAPAPAPTAAVTDRKNGNVREIMMPTKPLFARRLLMGDDIWDVDISGSFLVFKRKSLLSEEGMVEEWRCPYYSYMTNNTAVAVAPHFILILPSDGTLSSYYLFDTLEKAGMPIGEQGSHFSRAERGRCRCRRRRCSCSSSSEGRYIPVSEFIPAEP
ncbi:MAG: hypothetical protein WC483_00045 [Candidatus Paceibacterota bacterium]